MNKPDLTEISQALGALEIPPHFNEIKSHLFIAALKLIEKGSPVTSAQIEQLSSNIQIPFVEATTFLDRMAEKDDKGNIVGLLGLSQKEHPHRFEVAGKQLSTWCAWDSLFLPALLNKTAKVFSCCPATKTEIRLTVNPDKVERVEPADAVISMVMPDNTIGTCCAAKQVQNSFCCLVHFFSNIEASSEWMKEKSRNIVILTVDEGYELGRLAFKQLHKHIE